MMKVERKVLACVDQSRYSEYVTDYAAWAAQRMSAPLELLHVINRHLETSDSKDHSGAIGIDAQEQLLETLSSEDESRSKAARETGRIFLNGLRERAVAAGVKAPDVRQRYGQLEETLQEQEEEVRLFVLGRRGKSADETNRDIGRHVERTVRNLKKPILTVTEAFKEPQRAMIAFDGGIVTRGGVELVARSPLFKGMPIHLLMSGKDRQEAAKQLQWAKKKLEGAGFETICEHIPGDAETVIAKQVKAQSIDILLMGAYSHSPLRSLFLGSKTTDLLRSATIPTLLLR